MNIIQEVADMSIETTRNLEKAGMPRPQAEGVLRLVAEMIALAAKDLVSKDDLAKEFEKRDLVSKEYLAHELAKFEVKMLRMQLYNTGLTLAGVGVLLALFEFLG